MRNQQRFIRHPDEIPLELQVVEAVCDSAHLSMPLGLLCRSAAMLATGQQVSISTGDLAHAAAITGKIEWCRAHLDHYELHIRFTSDEHAQRMRMFEQVCHIRRYRQWVQEQQGRSLSEDEAALEWIAKYAALFPSNNL
ncbi:hypothetical protein A8C75_16860 [Marinobacterium aestuarii]|uniref:PilZ domain-containing protein n=1 Tax=Marinobacterium aestuarii TaxID=1821621 RepID=A0A1A9F1D2_9GAMM|nr:hypothetical protein [Marinobacterium aestuarii]ANG63975.1 hypothetical protein A8C75_16860 [Marinobacterium aestuarii]